MKPVLLNSINDYPKSGLGRITTASNQQVHEVFNGDYTFSFDMLVTDKLFKKIKTEMIIATSVSKIDTDFFYIKSLAVKSPGIITVSCSHVTMFTNENYVKGKLSIDGKKVKDILSEMTGMLDLPSQKFTYSTDIDKIIGKTDVVYENDNPGQILIGETNSLTSILDARLVRKGLSLKLTKKNTDKYIDLRKGKNISGVTINKSIDALTTSIVPYYKYKVDHSDSAANDWGYTIEKVSNGLAKVGSFDIPIYSDDGTKTKSGLTAQTDWKVDRRRTKNNDIQYRVGLNQWVDSSDVTFSGTIGTVTSKPVSPTYSNVWTVKKISDGIVKVGNTKANVFNDLGNATGASLNTGDSYVTDRRRTLMGQTQYRVATNQWVSDTAVTFSGKIGDVIPNKVTATNTDGWTIKRINAGGVVTAANTAVIYSDSNVANKTRAVATGSQWATDRIRSKSGVTQYRIGMDNWVNASDMTFKGSVGSVVSQPAPADTPNFNWSYFKVTSGTVTNSSDISVYDDDYQMRGGKLSANNVWNTDLQRVRGSVIQYRIGMDMWVNASDITLKGSVDSSGTQSNYTINSDGWTVKKVNDGNLTIGNTYAEIYTENNQKVINQGLAKASQWIVDRVRSKSGITQYRVGLNQWIDSKSGTFKGTIGQTISVPATATTTDEGGWKVVSVTSGIATVGNVPAELYNDKNVMVNNRILEPLSEWSVDRQRNKNGIYQFRVATNMWVLSNAVSFKGSLGKIISGATDAAASTTDDADDEQIQYGPEVNSPLKNNYKMAHRKYVDYSSRVDNLYDLVDVSNNYFIENPNVDKPTYTISIDVVNAGQKRVQEANIGDIARIYDKDYGLATDETIVERYFDPDLMTNKTVKAGNIQQTIFMYLDKRIKEEAKKSQSSIAKTGVDIVDATNSITDNISDLGEDVQSNYDTIDDTFNGKIDDVEKKAQEQVESVKTDVNNTKISLSNFMNSGGTNKLRWIPSLAEATQLEIQTDYGYWLLDDHGAGFHSTNGTVKAGLGADGRVYADSLTTNVLTGTTINGGNINSGTLNSVTINSAKIVGSSSLQIKNSAGNISTSIANYGITTPAMTVGHLDGVNTISTSKINVSRTGTIKYLHIASGGNISCDGGGLYLAGPVYVDGRRI
ncbi:hypothetical protein M5C72_08440 [Companilactobacillus allii]|uniref:Prophage tail endopeptidase domain-containing protein n=1 Tax=Companilactobacillus allii TaxID=1847728 RepID=A0A1P8Q5L0_9LACO|nr:hypothetical protein [Companilactobacillus allii]APX73109.1 hypothetical protein BTM29_11345 [Companilactobacillus allii]USQ67910.1 hypothetical protein M5C72_08440 [Companilactobacillus allii]